MLPKGWSYCRLEELSKIIDCKHRTPVYVADGVPVISPGTIKWGPIDLVTPVKRVTYEDYQSLMDHCQIDIGDLVMSRNQSVGVVSYIDKNQPFVLGQDTVLLKPRHIDSSFLFQFFQSVPFQRAITKQSGGSTFARINLGVIKELTIVTPPLPEQRKIAQILSIWDKAIATTERLLANKQQQKKALMQRLLTGKQRFAGFEGEWKTVSVSDVCSIGRGRVISKEDMYAHEGPYPVYSSQTLNNGVMGSIDTYDFDGEFVTWTTDGVNAGTVFHRQGKFNCTNVCGTLKPIVEGLDCRFLSIALSRVAYKYVSHTLANPKLMNGVMGTVQFQMPSLGEQQKIADVIFKSGYEIEVTQKQLDNLKQQKKALMQQLLTGKRRVKVDEAAA